MELCLLAVEEFETHGISNLDSPMSRASPSPLRVLLEFLWLILKFDPFRPGLLTPDSGVFGTLPTRRPTDGATGPQRLGG